jgi:hypothetical protein
MPCVQPSSPLFAAQIPEHGAAVHVLSVDPWIVFLMEKHIAIGSPWQRFYISGSGLPEYIPLQILLQDPGGAMPLHDQYGFSFHG